MARKDKAPWSDETEIEGGDCAAQEAWSVPDYSANGVSVLADTEVQRFLPCYF